MALSNMTLQTVRYSTPDSSERSLVESEARIAAILAGLQDSGSRAILDETSDGRLTAKELSEQCGLPLSTTYRKIDILTRGGLLAEGTRLRPSGKHSNEYRREADEIRITLGEPLRVTVREPPVESVLPAAINSND